jgi:hypothetical protein
MRFATAIDALCINEVEQKLVVIELKVSKHDEQKPYLRPVGQFRSAPFNQQQLNFVRSYKNYNLLQLLATYLCLKRSYKIQPDECLLIRVGADKIWTYKLPENILKRPVLTSFGKRLRFITTAAASHRKY